MLIGPGENIDGIVAVLGDVDGGLHPAGAKEGIVIADWPVALLGCQSFQLDRLQHFAVPVAQIEAV